MKRQLDALLDALAEPEAPTSVHGRKRGRNVHLADSLTALEVPGVREAGLIADLGAGAGLPGLVLAIALPDTQVALVESVGKKCAWMEATVERLGLTNARVVCARCEEWDEGRGACDVVTARALGPLAVVGEYAAPLLHEGGLLVAWKGAVDEREEADGLAAAAALGLERDAVLPVEPYVGSERRTLHVFRKVAPTPERYPRRAGMAAKRPLSARSGRTER
ncbi:MAG: 16S rRNA (guanine(527)-N(7))-methyltransferase RsmG [Solirubrobacteraceae bacterium]